MKEFLLRRVFGYVGRKLDGYKAIIGGVGMILMGLTYFVRFFFLDLTQFPEPSMETGFTYITGGFATLGIGGKLQKMIEAEKDKCAEPAQGLPESPTKNEG